MWTAAAKPPKNMAPTLRNVGWINREPLSRPAAELTGILFTLDSCPRSSCVCAASLARAAASNPLTHGASGAGRQDKERRGLRRVRSRPHRSHRVRPGRVRAWRRTGRAAADGRRAPWQARFQREPGQHRSLVENTPTRIKHSQPAPQGDCERSVALGRIAAPCLRHRATGADPQHAECRQKSTRHTRIQQTKPRPTPTTPSGRADTASTYQRHPQPSTSR